MIVLRLHRSVELDGVRKEPWEVGCNRSKWVDLVNDPINGRRNIIPELSNLPTCDAVEAFYQFLEWMNGPESCFRSTDCDFTEVLHNECELIGSTRQIDGRVQFYFRDICSNWDVDSVDWVLDSIIYDLQRGNPSNVENIARVGLVPTKYRWPGEEEFDGDRIQISFQAYGSTEPEALASLYSIIMDVFTATRKASSDYSSGRRKPIFGSPFKKI